MVKAAVSAPAATSLIPLLESAIGRNDAIPIIHDITKNKVILDVITLLFFATFRKYEYAVPLGVAGDVRSLFSARKNHNSVAAIVIITPSR